MTAYIYLHPDNFRYNKLDSVTYLSSKFRSLLKDMQQVVYQYASENKFCTIDGLYEVEILPGEDIYRFADNHLIEDDKVVLYDMLTNQADLIQDTTLSLSELEKKCIYSIGEEHPTSMVVLNRPEKTEEEKEREKHEGGNKPYITFSTYEIIYGENDWLSFRRQILGNHPEDASHFISECSYCFPDLQIHGNCCNSLLDEKYNYLVTSSRKIVYYLSVLNDCFQGVYERYVRSDQDPSPSPNVLLTDFSGLYKLDIAGSIEADSSTRHLRTFEFESRWTKERISVYCDPHLKIEQPDEGYKGEWSKIDFHPRIYFHYEYHRSSHTMSIYVGSIGRHL